MSFPNVRPRRLRRTQAMRDMLNNVRVHPNDLICPVFIDEATNVPVPINSMPGYFRLPIKQVTDEVKQIMEQGVKAVLLFGLPLKKDDAGTAAYASDGVVQKAVYALRKEFDDNIVVITDVCLCEYTSHGHCGLLKDNEVVNDETLEILNRIAVSHAQAGADIVAPSAMMDGQIKSIRNALDDAGFSQTAIMAYAVKYASSFYGPFREAADSAPQFGDRKSYQMSPGNAREALREIELDVNEGADIVMVKPALAYLDIINLAKSKVDIPIAAFNVSGEYAMIKAAAQKGWINENGAILELLTAIKRAGADLIITYHAKDLKSWINH